MALEIKPTSKVSILLAREKGQFPLSIATSLALESLLNIHPDTKHTQMPISLFNSLWVNLRTIFRNLYTSMERLQAEKLEPVDLAFGMLQDIEALYQFGNDNRLPIVLYHSEYSNFEIKYPHAVHKYPRTLIQKTFQDTQNTVFDALFKNGYFQNYSKSADASNGYLIRRYADLIRPEDYDSVGMLTHIAYDLLDSYKFSKLYLVESHIGNIKDKSLWYTKYHDGRSLPPLPFRLDLMQVFGDDMFFLPAKKNIRAYFLDCAKKYKWTPMTTKSRIQQSLNYNGQPELLLFYNQILKDAQF